MNSKGSSGKTPSLRDRADEVFRAMEQKSPQEWAQMTPKATSEILHDLSVHKIELELQNEELQRAQATLELSRRQYFDLYDLAPVGYLTLGQDGRLLQVNFYVSVLLGWPKKKLLEGEFADNIFREDRDAFDLFCQSVSAGDDRQECQIRLLHSAGHSIWVQLVATRSRNSAPVEASKATSNGEAGELRIVLTDVTASRQAEQELLGALQEKNALLREIHHRVKNNLQVISSLMHLESRRMDSEAARKVLADMQGRVRSMALLHEVLYRSSAFASVNLGSYLQQVVTQLFHVMDTRPGSARLRMDMEPVCVDLDQAMPCGLLVNELVSNSLKHGFPEGHSGEVCVYLKRMGDSDQCLLRVSDTGVGLPADFEARRANFLGLQLVSDLSGQLQGSLEIGAGPEAVFSVVFPVPGALKAAAIATRSPES